MRPKRKLKNRPGSGRRARFSPLSVLLLALLPALLLVSCAEEQDVQKDLETKCCQQCRQAASQDPAGMDISLKQCRGYDDKLDQQCREFFTGNPLRVEECRIA
ncbi:MAG: hypothetical protein AABX13_04215 [Nanoarchaeota archaeon]